MAVIIVCDNSDKLSEYLFSVLSNDYYVRYCKKHGVSEKGKGYPVDLYLMSKVDYAFCESCIIILGEQQSYAETHGFKDLHIVANSLCESQIGSLYECTYPVITCGSSDKDTVSYSSITDEYLTVSLNRHITAFSGREIQPLELPMKYSGENSVYSVLCATAVRILLDDFDSELGELY